MVMKRVCVCARFVSLDSSRIGWFGVFDSRTLKTHELFGKNKNTARRNTNFQPPRLWLKLAPCRRGRGGRPVALATLGGRTACAVTTRRPARSTRRKAGPAGCPRALVHCALCTARCASRVARCALHLARPRIRVSTHLRGCASDSCESDCCSRLRFPSSTTGYQP